MSILQGCCLTGKVSLEKHVGMEIKCIGAGTIQIFDHLTIKARARKTVRVDSKSRWKQHVGKS